MLVLTADIYFLTVLEAGSPSSRCWQVWVPLRLLSSVCRGLPPCQPSHDLWCLFVLGVSPSFYLFVKKSFFIWLCQIFAAACELFSLCCGMKGSLVIARDLVPTPGIKPGSPTLEARSLSYWTTRQVPPPLFVRSSVYWGFPGAAGGKEPIY